jgi:hypothetical protein
MLTLMSRGKSLFLHNQLSTRIGLDFQDGFVTKTGYLANCKPTTHTDQNGKDEAALLCYFIQDDGSWFKAVKVFEPYFLVQCDEEVIK